MNDSAWTQARLFFVFPLTQDKITVGQAVDNDLVLNDNGIEPHHAIMRQAGATYLVEDISRGKTWVSSSGKPTTLQSASAEPLPPGALVQFGNALFRFYAPQEGEPALVREFELRVFPARLGAASDNQVILDVPTVSRHHAEIVHREAHLIIRDLESTNGTFVALNGDPAQEHRIGGENVLRDGSLIRLGDVRLILRLS